MELSLWPSGKCRLLWVAFPSPLPGGAGRERGKGGARHPCCLPMVTRRSHLVGKCQGGTQADVNREGRHISPLQRETGVYMSQLHLGEEEKRAGKLAPVLFR